MSLLAAHVIYALAWLSFGLGHSLLAGTRAKELLAPALGPYYRIAYNLLAGIHLSAVWLVGGWAFAGAAPFALSGAARAGLTGLSILGVVILLLALRGYDLGRLAGTAQIRAHRRGTAEPEDEPLRTDGFHAWVRHPLYAGAYMILWGNAQDRLGLAMAIWGSAYLAVGTMFEERRLLKLYGEAYRSYRARVPAVFPWRGKAL
ncbi:MAG: isoprenylcysteine carboxylmethyltransferase family protein [Alphaproteobacteria bacterium]|nr:isoprenylcysteine carboxylmethyltransferase family protein [Alphaproteobacteria bacterium]